MPDVYLQHYGVLGMHWGVRRYQNKDGSLTRAGKMHYGGVTKRAKAATASYESNKTKRLKRSVEATRAEAAELRAHGYFEEADAVELLGRKNQEKLGKSVLKDAYKTSKKQAKYASKQRFTMSDEELLARIGRLEKQKRLRELTDDETRWGETQTQRAFADAGRDMAIGAMKGVGGVAVTAATGSAKLGLSTAINNAPTVDVANRTVHTTRVNTNNPISSTTMYSPVIGSWKVTNDGTLYIPDNETVHKNLVK